MPSELTLFVSDETGQEKPITVQTNPFTIGRQEGNDLVLSDVGLSRRHALITVFNEVAQITDCGSQNGTFLNGKPVSGNAVLKNGDVISLGDTCKLRVRWAAAKAPAASAPIATPTTATTAPEPRVPPPVVAKSTSGPSLSPTMIAVVATSAIVLLAGALIAAVALRKPKPPKDNSELVFTDRDIPPPPPTKNTSAPNTTTTTTTNTPATSDQFERSLVQAIRNISNDPNYAFAPDVQAEIKRRATQFATPTLANTLQMIAARSEATNDQIKAQGLKPALLIYLALAETNGGQAGDPLAVARQAVPTVQFLRGHFGSDFADPTLLVVAAYKIPGGSKKSHPLLPLLNRLVKNPQTDRNVWYLRQKGALSDTAYEFVLRFLAYGAIAQNPRQFGLSAPALIF